MIEKNELLEKEIFDTLIQSEIDIFTIEDNGYKNIIKSGKLINFYIKLPFLFFVIENNDKSRDFPIPQPFKFKTENDQIIFSYCIKDSVIDQNIVAKMEKLGKMSESKIYDKLVYIKISDGY